MKTVAGTPAYMCPEMVKGSYTQACDIWSCGIILYELVCGLLPADIMDQQISPTERQAWITSNMVENPDVISESCRDLLQNMLRVDEQARFSAVQVLRHKWLKTLNLTK
jgi:calcium-dependent protein kinase